MTTEHTSTHWVFRLQDGSKHSVGKYIDFGDGTFEGVATEQEAIDLLLENGVIEPNWDKEITVWGEENLIL